MSSKLLPLAIFLLSISHFTQAQSNKKNSYRYQNYFDLEISGGSGEFSSSLSWYHLNGIGKLKKFNIGYGVRFSSFVGANKYYTTAPAKFTSPVQGIGTILSKNITQNLDTVTTATALTNSLNAAIYLQYTFTSKFNVGFNIDVIGFSFGPKRSFNIISSSFDPDQPPVQPGSPTKLNLLLTSDNDIGSLNSQLFVGYRLTKKIGVRVGYTFLFSEYRTTQYLSFDAGRIMNDRYRYKASMVLLAVSFKPFTEN